MIKNEIEELKTYIDKKITLVYQWNGCGQICGKYKGGYYTIINNTKCYYLCILPYKCRKTRTYKMFNTKFCLTTNNFVIFENYATLYGLRNGGWGRPLDEDFYNYTHNTFLNENNKIIFEDIKGEN